jgi:hypothetical protein
VTCQWFSPGTSIFSNNKTDRHDKTEILLKVALDTINQPTNHQLKLIGHELERVTKILLKIYRIDSLYVFKAFYI